MKSIHKSRISMAVAAGLIGVASVSAPMQVSAQTTGPALSDANVGQVLLYPYYTVNGGWITTFNIMNTSAKTLAVKVRFHELKNSRDVLDFTVIMSPFDAWTAWVEDSPQGTRLRTVDNSCTSPVNIDGVNASSFAYTGDFDDTGGRGLNRLREGYVEVLVMGVSADPWTNPTTGEVVVTPPQDFSATDAIDNKDSLYVPYYSEHVDGVPRDCGIVDQAFVQQSADWNGAVNEDGSPVQLPTEVTADLNCALAGAEPPAPTGGGTALPGSGYPLAACDFVPPTAGMDNPLKGNVGWLNATTGYGAGSEAIAVEDWNTATPGSFVTAQQFPWFLEPTFATNVTLWTILPSAFEGSIDAAATFNEWANNPNNGARSDWVVSFPTKSFHVDAFNEQIQAASNIWRNNGEPVVECDADEPDDRTLCEPLNLPITVAPFEFIFGGVTAEDGTGTSPVNVQWNFYDREEGTAVTASDGTSISPAPPTPRVSIVLPYEANVITFADESVLGSNFPVPSGIDDPNGLPDATTGWAKLTFTESSGLPVEAFAIRAIDRTLDGQAYKAGYERPVE